MNGFESRYKTLGELLAELRGRLGFVAQGSATRNNESILKSFLQEAHDYVYGQLSPPSLKKRTSIQLLPNSFLYDWHNDIEDEDIDPGAVLSVALQLSYDRSTQLTQGITQAERAQGLSRERPSKYDTLNGQLEVWPAPNGPCNLLIEYTAGKSRFEQHSDRPSVPDRLVFLYALATAKAHYRQPDAQVSANSFDKMLTMEKTHQKGNRRFFVDAAVQVSHEAQVVRSVNGQYTLRS
jgi:hypothetical protein